jgi:glycosyltransferase involved in cell wall biosynthesis
VTTLPAADSERVNRAKGSSEGSDATGVSVALAVHRAVPGLRAAVASMLAQTLRPREVLLVVNGASDAEAGEIERVVRGAFSDDGAGVELVIRRRVSPGLAGALNEAFAAARCGFVARLDADDVARPARLERQAAFLRDHPEVAGVGSAFRRVTGTGGVYETVYPPTDPREVRWRLHLQNCFCHGSMLLRRDAVRAAGGYDERLDKAQDYELWSRMVRRGHVLANLPDVLYDYTIAQACDVGVASEGQGLTASAVLVDSWRSLPLLEGGRARAMLEEAVALGHRGSRFASDAARRVEVLLREHGPTRDALMAWLFCQFRMGVVPAHAWTVCKLSRLREVGREMRGAGVGRVWLYGAGRHTGWVLDHRAEVPAIAGIVDDHAAGSVRYGMAVRAPESVRPGEHVLLSSDWHEDAMRAASEPMVERGVNVWRLYDDSEAHARVGVA